MAVSSHTFGTCRSRRDCGNLEAAMVEVVTPFVVVAAVAATAAILRRFVSGLVRMIKRRRSRRDCGNLEAGSVERKGVALVGAPQSPRLRQS